MYGQDYFDRVKIISNTIENDNTDINEAIDNETANSLKKSVDVRYFAKPLND